jgi:cell division protein FtsW (lipid II flippase)
VILVPLLVMLTVSSWVLEPKIRFLLGAGLVLALLTPVLFRALTLPLDDTWAQRVAFWVDRDRLQAEQFFKYQAQVPILWAGSQGWFGGGFFDGDWYTDLENTAVNDNVASVFIQGELGGVGSILVMLIYVVLVGAALLFIRDHRRELGGFRLWVIFGVAMMFLWTAAAMFLQNLGHLPLTGKNLPLLGLDSKNDVLRYGLLLGLMLRYMRFFKG